MKRFYYYIATLILIGFACLFTTPAAADDTEEILIGLGVLGLGYTWYINADADDQAKFDELIETGKEHLGDWLVAGGNASLLDPNVQKNLLAGDYEAAAGFALPIVLNTMKNEATAAVSDPAIVNVAVKAAWEVIQHDELLAAMITRPGGKGLYWRYLAWRIAHGYSIAEDELWIEWPAGEDLHDLLQVAIPAVLEEYHATNEYLAAAIRNGADPDFPISAEPDGLDTAPEVW